MKKGLFLLPLAGALVLSGCTFTLFGKTITLFEKKEESGGSGSGGSGSGGSGGGGGGGSTERTSAGQEVSTGGAKSSTTASSDAVVLDFTQSTWKDDQSTPYVSADECGELLSFTYEGIEYTDQGCYANTYSGSYYLMMKNTKYTGGEQTSGYAKYPAFIGNKDPFDKPIKKVIVEVEGSSSSANTVYRASIHTEPQEVAATSGGFTGGKGDTFYTETTSDEGYYFTVSTNKTSDGKSYNGQVLKVTISF